MTSFQTVFQVVQLSVPSLHLSTINSTYYRTAHIKHVEIQDATKRLSGNLRFLGHSFVRLLVLVCETIDLLKRFIDGELDFLFVVWWHNL